MKRSLGVKEIFRRLWIRSTWLFIFLLFGLAAVWLMWTITFGSFQKVPSWEISGATDQSTKLADFETSWLQPTNVVVKVDGPPGSARPVVTIAIDDTRRHDYNIVISNIDKHIYRVMVAPVSPSDECVANAHEPLLRDVPLKRYETNTVGTIVVNTRKIPWTYVPMFHTNPLTGLESSSSQRLQLQRARLYPKGYATLQRSTVECRLGLDFTKKNFTSRMLAVSTTFFASPNLDGPEVADTGLPETPVTYRLELDDPSADDVQVFQANRKIAAFAAFGAYVQAANGQYLFVWTLPAMVQFRDIMLVLIGVSTAVGAAALVELIRPWRAVDSG